MRGFTVNLIALAVTAGIYQFAGIKGMVVAIGMIVVFELVHIKVYGKSMAKVTDEDHYDNPKSIRLWRD